MRRRMILRCLPSFRVAQVRSRSVPGNGTPTSDVVGLWFYPQNPVEHVLSRSFAATHSACLSRPPERMWTDAACPRSGRPGSLLTLAPHRSGRAGSAASGSSTDGFATRRRVPAGPGSQAMATAIPKACLASSAIRCRDVETGPNLGVLAVFPSNGATCRCPLPSTGSRGLNSPASAVL